MLVEAGGRDRSPNITTEPEPQGPMREILVSQLEPGPDKRDRSDLEADLRRRLMRPSAP